MGKKRTRLLVCLGLCLFLAFTAVPVSAQSGVAVGRYFPETGHSVRGGFLEFFEMYGGLSIFGYPITDEIVEDSRTVQYFEKARMEWHSEASPPNQIQLGDLGYLLHGAVDPSVPNTVPVGAMDARYFPVTGHIVSGPFLSFYDSVANGAMLFGNPITEVIVTDKFAVQYFERARFEQDRSMPMVVRLGEVGSEWLTKYPFESFTLPKDVPSKFFPDTGQWVRAAFLEFYERNGGKDFFGEPISGVFEEDSVPVQYFQRARFEWHPELAAGFQVTLGKVGKEIHGPAESPVPNIATPWDPNQRYFSQTGHIVSNAFLTYFDQHGGETVFGYPLSEAHIENGVIVQWFEKARFEWHPENPAQYQVLLGLVGEERYEEIGPATGGPGFQFGKVWEDNPRVANGLGMAMDGQVTLEMTEQYFEGGFILTWKGTNRIYVVYEGGQWESFQDTYRTGDVFEREFPVPADKYEPTANFGKIWWGLGGPGSKLGWAVEEVRRFTGEYQKTERGFMVRIVRDYCGYDEKQSEETDCVFKWIYVFYNDGSWEIYEDLFEKSFMWRPPELED